MENSAIIIDSITKQFGKSRPQFWERIIHQPDQSTGNGAHPANGNGSNGHAASNGKTKLVTAVDNVNFRVETGEIFGVLGPNGGGKSTLIRLISTLLLPDQGHISVFGYDVVRHSMTVRKLINRVSVEASFFKKLSPMENLMYGAHLYGFSGRETRQKVTQIMLRLGLDRSSIHKPMEEMSRGMQQKVAIARALLSRPQLLLLDEPTTGLDPRSKREVQALIREMNTDMRTTILLTTHDMVEAEGLCNRIAIMDKGRVVALDTPANLRKLVDPSGEQSLTLEDVFLELTGRALVNEDEKEEE